MSGEVPGTQGRGHQRIPTYRSFICGDDIYIVITANTQKIWQPLTTVLGLPAPCEDPRVNEARYRNEEELWNEQEAPFHQ